VKEQAVSAPPPPRSTDILWTMTPGPLYVHPAEARRQFREFSARPILREDLARGALLIALEEYPALDVEGHLKELETLSARVLERCADNDPGIFTLGHLQAEMFDVAGFEGDRENYYDVRNAYLNEVIDRKRGMPIQLSIIFLHLAHRAGLSAVGVGLPGHYIVKVQFELNEVYVDPFNRGETLTLPEIDVLLQKLSGGQVRLESEMLRGWTERQTLIRVLANLRNLHMRAGEPKKAASASERMQELADAAPEGM